LNTQLLRESGNVGNAGGGIGGDNVQVCASIECPICKQSTSFSTLDTLDDDYVMQNQLDMLSIERMQLDCTSCKTEEKAVARCADCAQFLCPNCVQAHQYMRCFENHKVVKFDEIKKIYSQNLIKLNNNEQYLATDNLDNDVALTKIDCGIPIHKPLFCKYHSKESLKFFCNTCQTPICSDCVTTFHSAPLHSYERITDNTESALRHVEELDSLVRKAKDNICFCTGEYQTLDSYLSEIQEQMEQSRGLINETFQSYKSLLETKKDELLKELEEKHSNKELLIMDTHHNIDNSIVKLNEAVKFTERILRNGNSSEILLLKKLISNQINHLIETVPQTDNIDTNLKFLSDQQQFQNALNATFGRFCTPKEFKLTYLSNLTNTSNNTLTNLTQTEFQQHEQSLNQAPKKTIDQQVQMQKIQQLQKQYTMFSQSERTHTDSTGSSISNVEQEWNSISNLTVNPNKKQQQQNFLSSLSPQQIIQLQQYLQQNKQSTISPSESTSTNDEWMNGKSISNTGLVCNNAHYTGLQFDEALNQVSKMQLAISPSESTGSASSSSGGGGGNGRNQNGQWPNSGNINCLQNQLLSNPYLNQMQQQQQQQQQQRVQSPLDPSLNIIKHNHQQQQFQNFSSNSSRSQTPANLINRPHNTINMQANLNSANELLVSSIGLNGLEEMSSKTTNGSIAHNFNHITKMIAPNGNNNLNTGDMQMGGPAVIANQNGMISMNQNGFSDSPHSPAMNLNGLDNLGNINAMYAALQSHQTNVANNNSNSSSNNNSNASKEAQFVGNGNLNPPVRQNGTMTNMSINNKFGALGAAKSQFNSPHGFCLGFEGEDIIVADTNNHRIQIFSSTGEFRYAFGSPGREEGQLWYPRKVTVMPNSGKFVVCDRGNERSRMQIFSKDGVFLKKISIRYIDIVAGIAITKTGDIVAVDSVSPTIFRISEEGELIQWFDCSDHMREPSDIAINGDEYFVCDFKGHCVVVFDKEGRYVRRIGGENVTNFPNGIDVSDFGDVLVGDSHGNRFHVAVFNREGIMLSEFECPYVKVSRCCGLKITNEGHIVTLAKNNHHVLILNTLYLNNN
jgi:hypothetical protein